MSARTNLYSLPALIGFSLFYEPVGPDKKAERIFIQYHKSATAVLEAVEGTQEEGIHNYLTNVISSRIIESGGYIEPLDEDVPDDYVVQYEENGKIQSEHHLFRYFENRFTLHLTLIDDFEEVDVNNFRQYLEAIEIFESDGILREFGSILEIQFDENSDFTRFGRRVFVNESAPSLERVEFRP